MGPKIPGFGIFEIVFENNIVIFNITALELSKCEILWKNKNAEVLDKKCLIWVFLGKNFKKLFSYLKSAPSNFSKTSFYLMHGLLV